MKRWLAAASTVLAVLLFSGCTPPCGPDTCPDGCCQGVICVAGSTAQSCGFGGATCNTCGLNQSCSPVSKSCIASGATGGGSGNTGGGGGSTGGGGGTSCDIPSGNYSLSMRAKSGSGANCPTAMTANLALGSGSSGTLSLTSPASVQFTCTASTNGCTRNLNCTEPNQTMTMILALTSPTPAEATGQGTFAQVGGACASFEFTATGTR